MQNSGKYAVSFIRKVVCQTHVELHVLTDPEYVCRFNHVPGILQWKGGAQDSYVLLVDMRYDADKVAENLARAILRHDKLLAWEVQT